MSTKNESNIYLSESEAAALFLCVEAYFQRLKHSQSGEVSPYEVAASQLLASAQEKMRPVISGSSSSEPTSNVVPFCTSAVK